MADADATSRLGQRSRARLTDEHLRRLAALAEEDHAFFTRPGGRPECKSRRLVVALAQGAALHYLDGHTGVKDLDVWTFYAWHAVSRALPLANRPHGISRRKPSCSSPLSRIAATLFGHPVGTTISQTC